uniref:DUF397 domain-containing protein n=1 Tax=Actinomadura rubrisoli TaxID=2530368 RepID=A0A4V2YU85_9ACTN|nr:DUF397 domain-containing protein [Actinomadura rubrisoli]TDD76687.1 DUF397 domain-containing protein [Actinomadura rubrisoli]
MVYRSIQGSELTWRKGSGSGEGSDCVEVAAAGPSVLVRDSRAPSAGMLALNSTQWRALVDAIQNGDLDGR